MQKNQLCSAQITSGIVILFIISLVSIFMSTPSLGLFGAIGQLIVGIYYSIKAAIGVTLGVTISIAYLIGIWLAVMYLVDPEKSKSMYGQVSGWISGVLSPAREKMAEKTGANKTMELLAANEESVKQIKNDFAQEIQTLRSDLDDARKTIEELQAAK